MTKLGNVELIDKINKMDGSILIGRVKAYTQKGLSSFDLNQV